MRLLLFITCIPCVLFSCQKQTNVLQPELTSNARREYRVTDWTEPYNSRMYNTCLNEWIALTGVADYHIKEAAFTEADGYYLDYIITLDSEGVGEVSGIHFHGGGQYSGRVRMSVDGLNVRGKVKYTIKYEAAGGNKMGYFQNAVFIAKGDAIKVQFNNEVPTCE